MNKRKFRIWDHTLLFDTYTATRQIGEKIEEKCEEADIQPDDLPMSLVPTDLLYTIISCYDAMYSKLLEEDLIKSGNPKTDIRKTH